MNCTLTNSEKRVKQIALSKALQNICQFYAKSSLEDFVAIAGKKTPHHSLALYSIIEHTRKMREALVCFGDSDVSSWPEEWSMQSGMVGRNAEQFNEEMEACTDLDTIEGVDPISWRRNGWEEVDGEKLDGVWHAIVIEIRY